MRRRVIGMLAILSLLIATVATVLYPRLPGATDGFAEPVVSYLAKDYWIRQSGRRAATCTTIKAGSSV